MWDGFLKGLGMFRTAALGPTSKAFITATEALIGIIARKEKRVGPYKETSDARCRSRGRR